MPDLSTILDASFVIGAGCVLVGILVFIHESGHYAVAKLLGIRVEVFSLGFGPKLLRFLKGGTEYCISAIPLGGYVKMLGENPEESLEGSREEFLSRSKFERFLVLVMGASLNIVLAIALTAVIFMVGVPEAQFLSQPPAIGNLDPNEAAARSGIRTGDVVLKVGEKEVRTWRDLQLQVALVPNRTIDFTILRDGGRLVVPVEVGETRKEGYGIIGVGPLTEMSVAEVEADGPAGQAGIRAGDVIEPEGYASFSEQVDTWTGQALSLQVRRGDERLRFDLEPRDRDGRPDPGMSVSYPSVLRQYGPVNAVMESLKQNWGQAGALFSVLKKLVYRELSPRSLSGPIEIFRLAGESLNAGLTYYLTLMAFISLQLGIINLLPIPVLDGGHIFILLVEGLIRRDLSLKIKERVMQFGIVFLLLLMGGVIYLDVYKNLFFD